MYPFRSASVVAALAGSDQPLVCLHFPQARDAPELYAHSFVLSVSSSVLREALALSHANNDSSFLDCSTAALKTAAASYAAAAAAPLGAEIRLCLDDADCTPWEHVLKLLYKFSHVDPENVSSRHASTAGSTTGSTSLSRVTTITEVAGSNFSLATGAAAAPQAVRQPTAAAVTAAAAECMSAAIAQSLLLLADKYDMAGIAPHVRSQLPTTSSSLVAWLTTPQLSAGLVSPFASYNIYRPPLTQTSSSLQESSGTGAASNSSTTATNRNSSTAGAMTAAVSTSLSPVAAVCKWLELCSNLGLTDQVQLCTHYLSSQPLALTLTDEVFSTIASLEQQHARQFTAAMRESTERLTAAMVRHAERLTISLQEQQQKFAAVQGELETARVYLQDVRQKAALPSLRTKCRNCAKPWYIRPNSQALFSRCIFCGHILKTALEQ